MSSLSRLAGLSICVVLLAGAVAGQTPPASKNTASQSKKAVGVWAGVSKGADGQQVAFTMDLKNQAGNIVGEIKTEQGEFTVRDGTTANGKLTMTFTNPEGVAGTIVATVGANTMTGEWKLGDGSGTFECKRKAVKSSK